MIELGAPRSDLRRLGRIRASREADTVMDAIEALVRSLPGEAARIRRKFWRDPEFREVCEDYRDALEAMRRLEPPHPPDPARAEEYRELAAELLAEAAAMLKGVRS